MVDEVSKADVIAFRLGAHHLTERLDPDGLLIAAGACGLQNSPPGSALLALHARVRNVSAERMETAIGTDKILLQTWSMRGAPFFFPTADAPVFTAGVLPQTEEARRHLIRGVEVALEELDMSLSEAVERTVDEVRGVLDGNRLPIEELGAQIAGRIVERLSPEQRDRWRAEGPYAEGQPLGEAVVHFCLRILTLQGAVCFAPRTGGKAPFVLVDEWLGHPIHTGSPRAARAELVRRYLHCYGPSTRADFAAWLGLQVGDVDPWWNQIKDETTKVRFGRKARILTADLDGLGSHPMPRGVRLLPPRDPYTQLRDRETIVDGQHHGEVWKNVGAPGAVLIDGVVAGTWRPRTVGQRLTVTVTTFDAVADEHRQALRNEVRQISPLRGAVFGDVVFART